MLHMSKIKLEFWKNHLQWLTMWMYFIKGMGYYTTFYVTDL